MNSVKVIGKSMAAVLLERIMANFMGTSVWLFEKKKKKKNWHEVNVIFFFQSGYLKYYLIENKYFEF